MPARLDWTTQAGAPPPSLSASPPTKPRRCTKTSRTNVDLETILAKIAANLGYCNAILALGSVAQLRNRIRISYYHDKKKNDVPPGEKKPSTPFWTV